MGDLKEIDVTPPLQKGQRITWHLHSYGSVIPTGMDAGTVVGKDDCARRAANPTSNLQELSSVGKMVPSSDRSRKRLLQNESRWEGRHEHAPHSLTNVANGSSRLV